MLHMMHNDDNDKDLQKKKNEKIINNKHGFQQKEMLSINK